MLEIFARADMADADLPPPRPMYEDYEHARARCVSAHEFLGDTFISGDVEAAALLCPPPCLLQYREHKNRFLRLRDPAF